MKSGTLAIFVLVGLVGNVGQLTAEEPSTAPAAPAGPVAKLSLPPAATGAMDAAHLAAAQKLMNGGIAWLLANRESDGGWSLNGANKPAMTAMVLKALLQHPDFDAKHPVVRKGFEVLMKSRQKDGGFYAPQEGLANYTTAVAVMALKASGDTRYNDALEAAVAFLKGQQIIAGSESADGQKITEDHPFFGGVSYGAHGRPDLSNAGYSAEALHEFGLSADDPYWKNMVVFVTRTQNLKETNPRPWAQQGANDGGFIYAPAVKGDPNTGESKAGDDRFGLRSYGSMTYTGFKSLLYAGVDRKDPRVQAALRWIREHWRLDSNPNMPQIHSEEGLYYYYHVFAKALQAWGEDEIADGKGVRHNWRHELIDALGQRVAPDGHWENPAKRWFEKLPALATCYSVLAIQEVMKK
ncbi:MAG TPA: hypothetical protein DCX07_00790 [Phycisphaerales bacterium]|nr:hypothetical protein [Phycisphaerales bacterium]